jgi:hypothetical protein
MREQGSGTRRLCETYLNSHQLEPSMLTLGSNGAIKNAARIGLGVALQSREAVALELELGLLKTIRPRGGLPKRSWYVVRSTIGPGSELAAGLHGVRSITAPRPRRLRRSHGDEVKRTRGACGQLGIRRGALNPRRSRSADAVVRIDARPDLGPGRDQVVRAAGSGPAPATGSGAAPCRS